MTVCIENMETKRYRREGDSNQKSSLKSWERQYEQLSVNHISLMLLHLTAMLLSTIVNTLGTHCSKDANHKEVDDEGDKESNA